MTRAIIAVIVSYLLMFVLMFVTFTCMYLLLGADGAFKPGSYDASNLWIALSFVVTLVVATIAGWICVTIAKTGKASMGLAIATFVLGLFLAIPSIMAHNVNQNMVRTGSVSNMEAMQRAKEPIWVPLLFPLFGATGALIGGRLKRQS
jgi:uncharacterized membrane protein YeaQ/YmgE (transglycosylase-associated protein family)